jgi:DNA-binding phage protein
MARGATKTGFDKFVDAQMRSPSFAREYAAARAEVDAVDQIVRAIDVARLRLGMTKAQLARAAGMRPEIVRRLFSAEEPNPTLETIVVLMAAVGRALAVVPFKAPRASKRPSPARSAANQVATLRGMRSQNSAPRLRTSA